MNFFSLQITFKKYFTFFSFSFFMRLSKINSFELTFFLSNESSEYKRRRNKINKTYKKEENLIKNENSNSVAIYPPKQKIKKK